MNLENILRSAFGVKDKLAHDEPITSKELLLVISELDIEIKMAEYKLDVVRRAVDSLQRVKIKMDVHTSKEDRLDINDS